MWKIGDDTSIPMWNNNWINENITITPPTIDDFPLANLWVKDCLLQDSKVWNVPLLKQSSVKTWWITSFKRPYTLL